MLELSSLVVGSFQSNCYLLLGREEAALIDPGAEPAKILDWIEDMPIVKILITHGHHDHVGALAEVRRELNVPVYGHALDADEFGFALDGRLTTGSMVTVGATELEVYEAPGHTPGSLVFALREDPFRRAVVGDAIFPGGPGHTRSHDALQQLMEALERVVFSWPDGVTLYPGHGSTTTVGAEREAFERLHSQDLPTDIYGDVTWR